MDLLTLITACALGFKVELFVPLGALDDCGTSFGVDTAAAPRDSTPKLERWATYISEAAQRFGRSEAWVRAVIQAESRGVADATSPAGAMGLMQIMPETYAELRARYGLGANAYDPHDNIIAGTAYMSEMIELFGVPNFLAAYNAGPARLEDHLRRGRPLPQETQRYLAQIGEFPPGEVAAIQPVTGVGSSSNLPSLSPRMTSGSVSAPRMISTPADEGQRRRLKNNAALSEVFVQRWNNRPATPSLSTQQSSDQGARSGDALFVPLGCDPMRLSANTPSRQLE
jgi:transglycosylase-like protein with SLT domain